MEGAHYIGGFGRIFDLAPDDLLVPLLTAHEGLVEAEAGIVEHMNDDHADAVGSMPRPLPMPPQGLGAWWASTPKAST